MARQGGLVLWYFHGSQKRSRFQELDKRGGGAELLGWHLDTGKARDESREGSLFFVFSSSARLEFD